VTTAAAPVFNFSALKTQRFPGGYKMKSQVLAALLVVSAIALGGCASGVNRPSTMTNSPRTEISSVKPLSSVTLSFTDEAKQKASENLKFNSDELLSHVRRALDANSLLKPGADQLNPSLEVRIKDVRIRSNFSAIMFGFMAGADSITADVIVKSPAGQELDRFEVSTSYALGGIAGGQDSARMSWLYEKFAEETLKELKKQ
jgi:hypothetical protein